MRHPQPVAPGFNRANGRWVETQRYKTFGKSHAPRLKGVDYQSISNPVHVVVGAYRRQAVFSDPALAEIVKTEILRVGEPIVAWCLMPNHLHLLLAPSGLSDRPDESGRYRRCGEPVDLPMLVKGIKAGAARQINLRFGKRKIWQESYYDHVLRKEETIETVALYILDNPVRKGIVGDWRVYPYSGSRFHAK